MIQNGIYITALLLPLLLGVLVLHTGFIDLLWYRGYENIYHLLNGLRVNETFLTFIGGWPLAVFTGVMLVYWFSNDEPETIPKQFLLLPLIFIPFSILGTVLVNFSFDPSTLYTHPLIILTVGYLYVLPWVAMVWMFEKIGLTV